MNYFTKFKYVYEPFRIGKVTVKNRFEMPPLRPRLGSPAITVGAWDNEQVEVLSTVVPETYVIGDASGKGDMYNATHSPYFCAMEL